MATRTTEERLMMVEAELTQLKKRLEQEALPQMEVWLANLVSVFKDDPRFEKAVRYGRAGQEVLRAENDPQKSSAAIVESFRAAIARVFHSWEEYPSAISKFRITGVMDTEQNRYLLTHVDFTGERYTSHLMAHLEILDGKIWILTDNTEEGIATELIKEGVSNDQIVLGFYPPEVRAIGECAVV